ncbi:MAG: fimbrial major subunit CsuA/B family protein [Brachymonas sp.]|nr:fimbrial major subunit CsuA/B family protein [Brachymonas sp.]
MRIRCKPAWWVALVLCSTAPSTHAYNCTLNVSNLSLLYSPTATAAIVYTGSYSFTCTRTAIEPANLDWDLAANNGLQPIGATNRLQLAATTNRYNYELYRNTTFTNANRWQATNALRFAGTLNFGSGFVASQPATTFYLRMTAPQTARPAGIYTDTVAATLRIDTTTTVLDTANFNVQVTTQNECRISTPPGNISHNYTAFQATASTANTNFQAVCTPGLSYTLSLDTTSGVLVGLNYSLALSSAASTGTGNNQNFTINSSVAAGQAGTCATGSCTGTQARTLTITY